MAGGDEELRRRVDNLERRNAELENELGLLRQAQRRRNMLSLPNALLSLLSPLLVLAVLIVFAIVLRVFSLAAHYLFYIGLALAAVFLIWYGNWLARRRPP